MHDLLNAVTSRPISKGLLLLGILAVSAAARISDIEAKSGIYHDESISYLMAGCRKPDLDFLGETAAPALAEEWKSLYRIGRPFCFGEIAQAASGSDVHPPLYYWLLHLWSLPLGVHLWTGPLLNLFLAIATTIILYFAAKDILGNTWEALLVTALYAFMPPVVHITAEARQYQLLALLSLVLVWISIRLTRKSADLDMARLSLVVVAVAVGALTHYHYILVVAGVAIVATARLARHNKRRLTSLLGALLVGYILANALFPMVNNIMNRAGRNRATFDVMRLDIRFNRLKMAAGDFDFLWYGLALGLIALVVAAIILLFTGGRTRLSKYLRSTNWHGVDILFLSLWLVVAVVLLYVTFFSPEHAMSVKYFSMTLPLIAFVPIFILRLLRYPWVLVLYFPLVALLFLANDVRKNIVTPRFHLEQTWDADDIVIIDARARGILPQILWHLSNDQRVIVGYQDFLIDNFAELEPHLGQKVVYISDNSYGNNEEMRQQLLDMLRRLGYLIEDESGFILIRGGIGRRNIPVYILKTDQLAK